MGRELAPALQRAARPGRTAGWPEPPGFVRAVQCRRPARPLGCRARWTQPSTPDDVKALAEERGIRFIRLWFTDILGQLKSFSINAAELDDAFEGGMGFDGSSITGFNAIEESDMIAMPDATTFAVLPWRPEDGRGVARMFCDVLTPEREPYEGDPRHVLRRAVERAKAMGFDHFNVGPELEYFLFRDNAAPRCSTRAATST